MSIAAGGSARVDRVVLGWTRWYSRDLPSAVAEDRCAELRADLWDHRAEGRWHHRSDLVVGLAILSRTLRGIPADLAWRREELGATPRSGVGFGRAWGARGSVALAAAIGVVALVLAVGAGARLVLRPETATLLSGTTKLSLLVGVLALQCGVALLRRARSRWLGALWLGFGAVLALRSAADTVFGISITASSFALPRLDPLLWASLGALGVFFVLLAVAWSPLGEERTDGPDAEGARG